MRVRSIIRPPVFRIRYIVRLDRASRAVREFLRHGVSLVAHIALIIPLQSVVSLFLVAKIGLSDLRVGCASVLVASHLVLSPM